MKAQDLHLPLFPTTSVGSFPKPENLKKARAAFQKGAISQEELTRLERQATAFWIRKQEEIGLDVLVDGEMYRGDMVAYFAEHMDGFSPGGFVRSYGNRFYRKPVICGAVRWRRPITVEWWKYAQGMTRKPVKGMLTGPYTVMDWSFNEHYPDRRRACLALAEEIRLEVAALVAAGARIIQIDEPAISVRPHELPFAIEAMEIVTRDLDAYFITHICYGAFEFIYPQMLKLPVHNFDLEMSNSELDLLELFAKHPFSKDLSFGAVDVHSSKIEPEAMTIERLRRAAAVLKPEQIWVDPDCGLKTRAPQEAIAKLERCVAAARALRQEYGA